MGAENARTPMGLRQSLGDCVICYPGRVGRRLAIALVLLLGGALAYAWTAGVLEGLDREHVAQILRDAGSWGPIGLVLAFALLEPFGAPGALFAIPATHE
jgi:hypothetical protein